MHPICTQVGGHQVFFSVLGVKGDWPYLRKVGVTINGVPRNTLFLHPCRLWPLTMVITAHASATFVVEKRLISSLSAGKLFCCRFFCPMIFYRRLACASWGVVWPESQCCLAKWCSGWSPQSLQAWRIAVAFCELTDLTTACFDRFSPHMAHRVS